MPSTRTSPRHFLPPGSVLLAALLLSGCATVYYPNNAVAPMFSNAGEFHAGGYVGLTGFEGQLAYSPFDHVGIAGSAGFDRNSRDTVIYGHSYLEGAVVGYLKLEHGVKMEGVAGIGTGHSVNYAPEFWEPNHGQTGERAEGDFIRYFVQPNISVSAQDFALGSFEAGLALRFAYVRFSSYREGSDPVTTPSSFFFEPVFFTRLGKTPATVELQLGLSKPTGVELPDFDWQVFSMSIGLHLVFGRDEPAPTGK